VPSENGEVNSYRDTESFRLLRPAAVGELFGKAELACGAEDDVAEATARLPGVQTR